MQPTSILYLIQGGDKVSLVRDQAVGATIDKKDKPALLRLAKKVRAEVRIAIKKGLVYESKPITEFWHQCKRKTNDHIAIFEAGNRKIELEGATMTNDLPTTVGIDQALRLILASSSFLYTIQEIGSGSGTPAIGDVALFTPYTASRLNMTVLGTVEPVGMTLRFLGVWGESFNAPTITEVGIWDRTSGGNILNHNVFSQNPLNKITNQQAAVISSIVEFCPKA